MPKKPRGNKSRDNKPRDNKRGERRRRPQRADKPDWVIGVHAVEALLRSSPERIQRLHIWRQLPAPLQKLVESRRVEVAPGAPENVPSAAHLAQGVAARVSPFIYQPLERFKSPADDAVLLVLDGVTDTRNLGSILRSAGFFGVDGVVLPKDRSASVTGVTERVARGGSAVTPVARVTNVARTLQQLSKWGWTIVGTALEGANCTIDDRPWQGPVCLVLGAEDRGIRPLVRAQCDHLTVVQGAGAVQSLNVASFATVAIWELTRNRGDS